MSELPTEPYTVIRVTWKAGSGIGRPHFFLHTHGDWFHIGPTSPKSADEMNNLVGSFEIVSEPRAVTAKTVVDRLFNEMKGDGNIPGWALSEMADDFGVGFK